jgi:transcriptional activator SPT7
MDLGTVLKKVKGQQYKDKKSFAADLELIWTNCMEYNTLPVRAALHALP